MFLFINQTKIVVFFGEQRLIQLASYSFHSFSCSAYGLLSEPHQSYPHQFEVSSGTHPFHLSSPGSSLGKDLRNNLSTSATPKGYNSARQFLVRFLLDKFLKASVYKFNLNIQKDGSFVAKFLGCTIKIYQNHWILLLKPLKTPSPKTPFFPQTLPTPGHWWDPSRIWVWRRPCACKPWRKTANFMKKRHVILKRGSFGLDIPMNLPQAKPSSFSTNLMSWHCSRLFLGFRYGGRQRKRERRLKSVFLWLFNTWLSLLFAAFVISQEARSNWPSHLHKETSGDQGKTSSDNLSKWRKVYLCPSVRQFQQDVLLAMHFCVCVLCSWHCAKSRNVLQFAYLLATNQMPTKIFRWQGSIKSEFNSIQIRHVGSTHTKPRHTSTICFRSPATKNLPNVAQFQSF